MKALGISNSGRSSYSVELLYFEILELDWENSVHIFLQPNITTEPDPMRKAPSLLCFSTKAEDKGQGDGPTVDSECSLIRGIGRSTQTRTNCEYQVNQGLIFYLTQSKNAFI